MAYTTANDTTAKLLDGDSFILRTPYVSGEANGVLILAIISCISATAVTGLLLAIALSAYNTRKSTSSNLFVRSHVAAYFVSLLLCEIFQTVGSIMNIRWYNQMAVTYGPYCTVQGVVKHFSDVGSAYWSLIIAMNTFWILFLRWKLKRFVLISALVGGWSTIGAIVSAGPGLVQKVDHGPFYAISGYWCWIADDYPTERITMDYMIMFLSAALSFVMYVLVFLKLRGNVMLHGWRLSFRFGRVKSEHSARSVDSHAVNVAKSMLLYPLAYTILLLPIAVTRFVEWTGHEVPFTVTILCDSIFLLSGTVNVVLFLTTRRVLPVNSVIPRAISQRFSRGSTRDSKYSTNSTSTTFTDIEKVVYAESALSRTDSRNSHDISARAPTRYPDTPSYSPTKVVEEYATDDLADDTQSRVSNDTWRPNADSRRSDDTWRPDPELRRSDDTWRPAPIELPPLQMDLLEVPSASRLPERSPTIPVAIPTGEFRPFGEHPDNLRHPEV
ncbi:hypothetical protein C2E23DRAFT_827684 [Lenzites betulinus]|nr:hypothetical protein C2E23DRAFT_827684 [Lenzites betulinus]